MMILKPINTSTDDIEASNSNSGSGIQTAAETGSETAAVSPQNDHIEDVTIDISDQPNIPGEEVPENDLTMFVKITTMLETMASGLGKLEIVGMMAVLQGGFAFMLQKNDFVFIIVILLFEGIRVHHRSMRQSALFYWFQLISALTTTVLSGMQLYSQDFGQIEKINKANSDFALNLFYVVELAKALMLLVLASCYLLRRPFGN